MYPTGYEGSKPSLNVRLVKVLSFSYSVRMFHVPRVKRVQF